jgi:hypothetical protein
MRLAEDFDLLAQPRSPGLLSGNRRCRNVYNIHFVPHRSVSGRNEKHPAETFQSAKDAFVQKITGLGWMRRVISPIPGHEPQEGFDSQRQPSIRVPFVPDR